MKPYIGQIVQLVTPGLQDVEAAVVITIHTDSLVDLIVFGREAMSYKRRVPLIYGMGAKIPTDGHALWIRPAKTEG